MRIATLSLVAVFFAACNGAPASAPYTNMVAYADEAVPTSAAQRRTNDAQEEMKFKFHIPSEHWLKVPPQIVPPGFLGALSHDTNTAYVSAFATESDEFDHPGAAAMFMYMSMVQTGFKPTSVTPTLGKDWAIVRYTGEWEPYGKCEGAVMARYSKSRPEYILLFVGVWSDDPDKRKVFMDDFHAIAAGSRLQ